MNLLGAEAAVYTQTLRNFDDIQVKHLGRIFGRMVRVRLRGGLALALLALTATLLDPVPWRVAWLGVMLVSAGTALLLETRRFAREGFTARRVPINLWLHLLFQQGFVLGTGGITSPLLPTVLPIAFVASLASSPRQRVWLLLAELGSLTAMSVAQLSGWLPGLALPYLGSAPPNMLLACAGVMGLLCVASTAVGGAMRRTFDNMLSEALSHRDELLSTHRAHARELEALSGEIAHELKNPLATVKGLTQLMAREPGQPQSAERLKVLTSEVTRMQGILEEFLNFSRPLVPLTVSAVDLSALCEEALVLHEGLAGERGVKLERAGSGRVSVACDSRKVKQVLMNLLHNAIEASPPGGRVVVTVESTAAGDARVSVRDEGSGLASEVAGRVFEAGVTTKARGSGLGLTVARALARQHGGEVTLEGGPHGGCVAELLLPRELPAGTLGSAREVAHG
ncbi:sensor histidine kinase [Hyalangium rubrum]|uniref:histidine kinase n=1 Tax=Hyalangium rubrum TaxID=3103134 RepID=A0ABU5GZZ0_9BACT|nr:HAMP domain-containing sensor histidine kinase [Hyalangium sp. s54d21]MDY7226757.1 HAMP domain-containing sensor histidine kinase [Hyalangium sp. s54d21]